MKKGSVLFLAISLIVVIVLPGCSLPVSTGGTPTPTPTPTPIRISGGECDNALWPIEAGASWSYKSEGSEFGDYTFMSTVIDQEPDSFILEIHYFSGVVANQHWQCDSGNLITLTVGGGLAASLSTINGTNAQVLTGNSSGVTLPAHIEAEDTWSQTLDVSGSVTMANGKSGTAEGTYVITAKAGSVESVSVPAGDFEALRIDQQSIYNLNVTVEGMTIPMTVVNMASLWYVPRVGLVQVVNTNDIMGTETISLTGYNVP
jgi:hypothetical protein